MALATSTTLARTTMREVIDQRVAMPAVAGLAALALAALLVAGWRHALAVPLGAMLGITLYHASFGFTSAWRRFIATGEGSGLRAQMVMLAIAVCLFFPALASGDIFGRPVGGFVAPAGFSVAVGAFLFGVGMQIGGGCASGTLFTAGGGSTRMLVVLFFFVVGSVVATLHLPFWYALPALRPWSFVGEWGLAAALASNMVLFALIWAIAYLVERHRRPEPRALTSSDWRAGGWLTGPWPLLAGAVGLALLNFATLWLAGRPWGITSAFALWGAKWFELVGIDVTAWSYWRDQADLVDNSVLYDITSVMNFGIILGAMLAAGLAGKFQPKMALNRTELLTAVLGGLLLGYGARLAFGCNIGAFFSGVASGSLHGWLWLVCGFLGNVVGTSLRPKLGMART